MQHRAVYCVDTTRPKQRLSDDYCVAAKAAGRLAHQHQKRPRHKRTCNKISCPYEWQTEDWSDCSHPCGAGIQHRRVTCHRINAYDWTDPEPVSLGCNDTQRPADLQPCKLAECDAHYFWKPAPWQAVSIRFLCSRDT